jgi:hypothetical protein
MCQRGADQMGAEGHAYREILAFYFPGTELGLTARGLPSHRMTRQAIAPLSASGRGFRSGRGRLPRTHLLIAGGS